MRFVSLTSTIMCWNKFWSNNHEHFYRFLTWDWIPHEKLWSLLILGPFFSGVCARFSVLIFSILRNWESCWFILSIHQCLFSILLFSFVPYWYLTCSFNPCCKLLFMFFNHFYEDRTVLVVFYVSPSTLSQHQVCNWFHFFRYYIHTILLTLCTVPRSALLVGPGVYASSKIR